MIIAITLHGSSMHRHSTTLPGKKRVLYTLFLKKPLRQGQQTFVFVCKRADGKNFRLRASVFTPKSASFPFFFFLKKLTLKNTYKLFLDHELRGCHLDLAH